MSLRYRPEIDGLRAIAIGAVLIYHFKLPFGEDVFLRGGFLGVDVFFVISGYLITAIILTDLDRPGGFSYADFYERRARRLLPPLLVVLAASAVAAYFILLPEAMVEFAQSALASLFFLSNIYWQLASQEYGATSGLYQPLLHTWSLAVEEQFYLIYPTFLLLALRWGPNRLMVIGLGVVVAGLLGAELLTRASFSVSFYWPISRVWELVAGALVAVRTAQGPIVLRGTARHLPTLGLGLIAVSMAVFSLSSYHPGLGTVPAVLGTVLILAFAMPGDLATRILSSRAMVGLGLVSYSFYLWHYPVYAFGRILRPDLIWFDYVGWILLSGGLAWLSWRFVERPFRSRRTVSLRGVIWMLGGASALVSVFAVAMIATDGMRGRLTGLIALYGVNEFDNGALREASWGPLADRAAAQGFAPSDWRYASTFESDVLWFDPDGPRPRVLVVGDSHSKDMYNVLTAAAEVADGFQVARYALPLREASAQVDGLLAAANFEAADIVVISYRYTKGMLPNLPILVEAIQRAGKDVTLLSSSVEFPEPASQTLFDVELRRNGSLDINKINALAWSGRSDRTAPFNAALAEMAAELGVPLLRKEGFVCNDAAQSCAMVTPEGRKAFYDYGHYTLEGAAYFGKRVAELRWFAVPDVAHAEGTDG